MVQHVQVVFNTDQNPVAEATTNPIWRDDQQLCWFFSQEVIDAGWGWDNSREAGPNRAIEFNPTEPDPLTWPGSIPAPVGEMPNGTPDIRHYCATGPGANAGIDILKYAYRLYFAKGSTKFSHDPEIGNQPQP